MDPASVVTLVVEGILKKVSSLVVEDIVRVWKFKAELEKLKESLESLDEFLLSASEKPKDQSKAVTKWVQQLKDVAEDADDVLDEFNYELIRRKVMLQDHMKRKVLNFVSTSNPFLFRVQMSHKIKKINDSLEKLKKDAVSDPLIMLDAKKRASVHGLEPEVRDQTNSNLGSHEVVIGRKDIENDIVKTLVDSNNEKNHLSVLAIVGMPGLGKTTLAQSVYNTPLISESFDEKIWVCVSNTFDVDVILNQMVESLAPSKAGLKSQDALIKVLTKELTGKRFVLVLDDVWNEDSGKWKSLMSCLSNLGSNKGSCIVITTRSVDVASIAETLTRPQLKTLTDDECWSILKQRAWKEEYSHDANRETIGRAIAVRCGGIPLVAKVLGALMYSKARNDEWLSIQNSEIWGQSKEGYKEVMSILKLSFDNLKSPTLKQCFAYCSMLEKDFKIKKDELVQLWMAQGLLQEVPVDQIHYEMENTGNQYFNILLHNSLLQKVPNTKWVDDSSYTMHDLVHDLAIQVSKCDSLIRDCEDTSGVRHVAHVSTSTLENISKNGGRLRSLFSHKSEIAEMNFCKFKSLRVLSLSKFYIHELPTSIGNLKHLRYLDVSRTGIKALPSSIGKLYNLQTLRMQGNLFLEELPREIQNLKNLRHLYVEDHINLPAGVLRELTNLRKFPCFRVSKEMGYSIEELGGLNKLRGTLTIDNLQNVKDEEEAKKAKLQEKNDILWLSLEFGHRHTRRSTSTMNDEKILEGLQPHFNLQSLTIDAFMGDRFPSWMMKVPLPLMNLKKLTLRYCLQCGELPVLGHLPFLEVLKIDEMKRLKCMGSEMYGYDHVYEKATREMKESVVLFPALKRLIIKNCDELSEWKEAPTTMASTKVVTVFPCLEELTIKECSKIGFIPIAHGMTSLRLLKIQFCRGLSSIGQLDHCTSLQELSVTICPKLEELNPSCHSLEKLDIIECNGLRSLPDLGSFLSLRELSIYHCTGIERLPFVPVSLEKLKIYWLQNLESIPISLEEHTSLRRLVIGGCSKLKSVPTGLGYLTRLEYLELGHFWEELDSFPEFQVPPQLARLSLTGWDKLKSLPQQLQQFTLLTELTINSFNGVETLPDWLGNLASLVKLEISFCENLKYLPSLEAMQRLTKLHTLEILHCPFLEGRCVKDSGEEWPKISHIPDILVNFD